MGLTIDPPSGRYVSGRADDQGRQGTRSARQENPEARRRGERGGREAEGARVDEPLPETLRRLARELHALFEGDDVRLRRSPRQDHRRRGEIQRGPGETGGRRQGGRRATGRGMTEVMLWSKSNARLNAERKDHRTSAFTDVSIALILNWKPS